MRRLAQKYSALNVMLHTIIGERLNLTELTRGTGFDQQLLRELRTAQPEMETAPAAANITVRLVIAEADCKIVVVVNNLQRLLW